MVGDVSSGGVTMSTMSAMMAEAEELRKKHAEREQKRREAAELRRRQHAAALRITRVLGGCLVRMRFRRYGGLVDGMMRGHFKEGGCSGGIIVQRRDMRLLALRPSARLAVWHDQLALLHDAMVSGDYASLKPPTGGFFLKWDGKPVKLQLMPFRAPEGHRFLRIVDDTSLLFGAWGGEGAAAFLAGDYLVIGFSARPHRVRTRLAQPSRHPRVEFAASHLHA